LRLRICLLLVLLLLHLLLCFCGASGWAEYLMMEMVERKKEKCKRKGLQQRR
jgi:hypothetical protein